MSMLHVSIVKSFSVQLCDPFWENLTMLVDTKILLLIKT